MGLAGRVALAADRAGAGSHQLRPDCRALVRHTILRLGFRHLDNAAAAALLSDERLDRLTALASDDLLALAARDPAAQGCWQYVSESYVGYHAVLAYRLAHLVYRAGVAGGSAGWRAAARRISEAAKVECGVEIHPAASIGRRFAVDHGYGVVIGETAVIGDDCYVLQGVVLGARGIAHNPCGRRHPTLCDRVEVGAFTRILGPITIGDDVRISAGAVIAADVPAGNRVRICNQYQIATPGTRGRIFGVVPVGGRRIDIHGAQLADSTVELFGAGTTTRAVHVLRAESGDRVLRCQLTTAPSRENLRLVQPGGAEIVVSNLDHVWHELGQRELSRAGDSS